MQEDNIVYLKDYKSAKAEKVAFLKSLEYDIIDEQAKEAGRPITPSEIPFILKGRKITLAILGGLGTIKRAINEKRLDLIKLFTDILHELKAPGISPSEERTKTLQKTMGNNVLSFVRKEEQSEAQYAQALQEQQDSASSLTEYMLRRTNDRTGTDG